MQKMQTKQQGLLEGKEMTHKEKKQFVNDSLKELFPEYSFHVDRDMLDIVFQHLKQKTKSECVENQTGANK